MSAAVPVLETPRLIMRETCADDAEGLLRAYGDDELMRYWSRGPMYDVEEVRAYIGRRMPGWRGWTIIYRENGEAIGTLAAAAPHRGVEIGYMVARPYWRSGIASEAVTCLIDHLFGQEGATRVFADTDPDNIASRRLLERLGFVLEGCMRGAWHTHIGVRDGAIYGLLEEDWTRARSDGLSR